MLKIYLSKEDTSPWPWKHDTAIVLPPETTSSPPWEALESNTHFCDMHALVWQLIWSHLYTIHMNDKLNIVIWSNHWKISCPSSCGTRQSTQLLQKVGGGGCNEDDSMRRIVSDTISAFLIMVYILVISSSVSNSQYFYLFNCETDGQSPAFSVCDGGATAVCVGGAAEGSKNSGHDNGGGQGGCWWSLDRARSRTFDTYAWGEVILDPTPSFPHELMSPVTAGFWRICDVLLCSVR